MFRMGAELAAERTDRFRYALLSKWPVNAQNAPKTEMEAAGLDAVAADPSRPFYGTGDPFRSAPDSFRSV